MKTKNLILLIVFLYPFGYIFSQSYKKTITLAGVIDTLALASSAAEIEYLNFRNDLLAFDNYKKSLLPSLTLNFNPLNFNRSLKVLQQPGDGSYSYVEDYSNNSSAGISIRQKIGWTGGELNFGSNLNYLNEFSQKRNSFNTSMFTIGYSQQIFGGGKNFRFENEIEYAKKQMATKRYCTGISQIQQEALGLFMTALLDKLECDLSFQNNLINDTLLIIADVKLQNGSITEYDFSQIELQALNTRYTHENAIKGFAESSQRLMSFLGIDYDSLNIISPHFDLPLSIDIPIVLTYVEMNNPFRLELKIKKLEAERSLFSVKLSNRFNGNINLNYGMNQYAETFTEAYRHGNSRQSIAIGFQIPIFQWGINRNKVRIAENSYKASQLEMDKRIRDFENEIKEKVSRYNHSVKLWITAEKAYVLSRQQYRMLATKFSLGKVSVYELTAAQNDQDGAMERYYSAIRDVYESYFSLRHIALYDFKREEELKDIFIENL